VLRRKLDERRREAVLAEVVGALLVVVGPADGAVSRLVRHTPQRHAAPGIEARIAGALHAHADVSALRRLDGAPQPVVEAGVARMPAGDEDVLRRAG